MFRKNAEKQRQSDINRRFFCQYFEGVIFDYDAETNRYRVRSATGVDSDWCRAFQHVGLNGTSSIGQRVTVWHPNGDDENGIIVGVLADSDFNR